MLNDFISIIFPQSCIGCTNILMKGETHICSKCNLALPLIDRIEYEELIHSRFYGRYQFSSCFAYLKFNKGGISQKILFALKYQNNTEIGFYFGKLLGFEILNGLNNSAIDMIIPVPLHKKRYTSRGYNQSDFLADAIGEVLNISVNKEVMLREKYTESFTRKNRLERTNQIGEIFEVNNPELVKGRHILLVDDVITTGSTLEAMAVSLKESGVGRLSIASLAVAV